MGFYVFYMGKTILFLDGENFRKKCTEALRRSRQKSIDWNTFDFQGLLHGVLYGVGVYEKRFYAAKLLRHPQTAVQSEKLIQQQRHLKANLGRQKFAFIVCGRVRGYEERDPYSGRSILVFREKGVDVKMAVDLITMACDGVLETAIIGSSDSDLQPAIKELAARKVQTIYLGFVSDPNKGLMYTTARTILISDKEILRHASA